MALLPRTAFFQPGFKASAVEETEVVLTSVEDIIVVNNRELTALTTPAVDYPIHIINQGKFPKMGQSVDEKELKRLFHRALLFSINSLLILIIFVVKI